MSILGNGLKWFNSSISSGSLHSVEIEKTDSDTVLSWSGPSYILGMNMIQVFRNGNLLNLSAYRELTGNSIEYLDSGANPIELGDIFSIRYIPGNINLGEIVIKENLGELELIPRVINGTVAITTNDKRFWLYKIDKWEEFVIPLATQNVGIMFENEEQKVHGDLEYSLADITYHPGMGNLVVFVDGEKVNPSEYTETDSSTIVFKKPQAGKEIQFIVGNTDSWADSFNNLKIYEYDIHGNVRRERVSLNNGTIPQDTYFIYDERHNVTKEIVTRGAKTISKTYDYDARDNVISCRTIVT